MEVQDILLETGCDWLTECLSESSKPNFIDK